MKAETDTMWNDFLKVYYISAGQTYENGTVKQNSQSDFKAVLN